jgi:hypothetical protein
MHNKYNNNNYDHKNTGNKSENKNIFKLRMQSKQSGLSKWTKESNTTKSNFKGVPNTIV